MFPKHSRSRAADTGLEMVMTKAAQQTNKASRNMGGRVGWSRRQRAQNPSSRPLRAAEKESSQGLAPTKTAQS